MKIVHIITRMILGGAQENTLLTCEGLCKRGHEVTLITGPASGPEGELMSRAREGGYRVIEVGSLMRAIRPIADLRAYFKIKKLLKELEADIVHTHSAKAGILGRWAAGAVRAQAVKSCCGRVDRFRAAQRASSGRPRIVHTIHGLAFHPYQASWKNKFYIRAERAAARRTDLFVSVAQAMTDQALMAGIGREEQFVKIFSGIETGDFLREPNADEKAAVRKELDIAEDAVVIISIARLFELKGHEYIIESAKVLAERFEKAVWLFVGDGILRGQIEREIAEAGLERRFRLAGLVEPSRIAGLLHASDILVHCSLREGLARALPQALLCGKGVISFDVDGAREVVNPGKTGYLVAAKDVGGLVEAQEKLMRDAELRSRFGAAGREYCQREFDHEAMVDKIEQVYKSLL